MRTTNIDIVRLDGYQDLQELKDEKVGTAERTNKGIAVLIGQEKDFLETQKNLMRLAINEMRSKVKSCEDRNEFNKDEKVTLDPELKHFLYALMNDLEWLMNCASMTNAETGEFEFFDKIELQDKMERLGNRL